MKKNPLLILLALTSIFGIAFSLYTSFENMRLQKQVRALTPGNEIIMGTASGDACETRDIEYMVSGNSMSPLLQDGQKLQVVENHYTCT